MREPFDLVDDRRPLSPSQRAMWFTQRRHPEAPIFNEPMLFSIDGHVDLDRLAAAFGAVVASDPLLRARLIDDGADPHWQIDDRHEPRVGMFRSVSREEFRDWAEVRARVALDPTEHVYEAAVASHPDGSTSWYLNIHHLATDAVAITLVVQATSAAYLGDEFRLDPFDEWFSAASRSDGPRVEVARRHWATVARRIDELGPLDRLYAPRPASANSAAVRLPLEVDPLQQVPDHLRSLSTPLSWTVALVAAASIYARRLADSASKNSVTVGIPVHQRSGRARLVSGPTLEVIPVVVDVDDDDTVGDVVERASKVVLASLGRAVPLTAPAVEVDAMVNVIADVGVVEVCGRPSTTEWLYPGAMEPSNLFRLQLTPYGGRGGQVVLDLNQATGPADASRAAIHAKAVVDAVFREPAIAIGSIELTGDEETQRLVRWGTGAAQEPQPVVTRRLRAALADRRDTAVRERGGALTGEQLWQRVERMAAALQHEGVAKGDRVGVQLPRSIDALVAIYSVMLCGASFVPIDPEQPTKRRERLARLAQCRLVLDTDRFAALSVHGSVADPLAVEVEPDDEAYLLFTSGSSGEPKGVPITHAGLSRYLDFAIDAYLSQPSARQVVAALFTALTFDLTITTVFAPLIAGATVTVIEPNGPEALIAVAQDPSVTWIKATPTHLDVLCRLAPQCQLERVVVGGEQFTKALAQNVANTFEGVTMFNEYGPTEAVVGCMLHRHSPDDAGPNVPIGSPAPGIELKIVDSRLLPVPIGAAGELLIAGEGLTAGYLNPADNADRFVRIDGTRWYRSGDLVRLLDDRAAVYLGRIDDQLKLGGIRIEPAEIEAALLEHPNVAAAHVGVWGPSHREPSTHCVRCGLPDNVPGSAFDAHGVCSTCLLFERIEPQTRSYFGTLDQLAERIGRARTRRTGEYDVLHLLSGGKDSTYALYQLVRMGFRVFVLTLDNGFISPQALDNVRRTSADLGVDFEIATSDSMNEAMRASLERFSNVCQGCYKTIYTLAGQKADELGIPVITTGLSRGQLFETRLAPHQFEADRFEPDAIDAAVVEARKAYHRADDPINRVLDTTVFDDAYFDRVEYVDFYRYAHVPLTEMLEFLDSCAPWTRPSDTGRSTNCLVNAAGIHVHLAEQGYHNYAIPYAWDVRLGHKTRDEAIAELNDDLDLDHVSDMLGQIGYAPSTRKMLTAWVQPATGATLQRGELSRFVAERVPAHAVPTSFVEIEALPLTSNGKLDSKALPEPGMKFRSSSLSVGPSSALQRRVAAAYERILSIQPVGVDDDFFELGGDSLAALALAASLRAEFGVEIADSAVFAFTTPRVLADALEGQVGSAGAVVDESESPIEISTRRRSSEPPPVTLGEEALLSDYALTPSGARYHVAIDHRLDTELDLEVLAEAVTDIAATHDPMRWTYAQPRRLRTREQLVEVTIEPADLPAAVHSLVHERYDVTSDPLVRLVAGRISPDATRVALGFHHVCIDELSIGTFLNQVAGRYEALVASTTAAMSRPEPQPPFDSSLGQHDQGASQQFWLERLRSGFDDVVLGSPGTDDGIVELDTGVSRRDLERGTATPFTAALTAIGATLARRATGPRIAVGVVASARSDLDSATSVGYGVNILPLVLDIKANAPFDALTVSVAGELRLAIQHRSMPLVSISQACNEAGVRSPDVSIIVAAEQSTVWNIAGTSARSISIWPGTSVASATFFVRADGPTVVLALEYSATALDRQGAELLLADAAEMLAAAADDPTVRVGEIGLPSTPAGDGNTLGEHPPGAGMTLHDLVRAAMPPARETPAVICGEQTMSWEEMLGTAASVAKRLGDRSGDMVAVDATRQVSAPAAMLGVLAAGAAYVPLDLSYPDDHVRHVVADASIDAIVSRGDLAGVVSSLRRISPTSEMGPHEISGGAAQTTQISPDDPAYVIYTSGSTGTPKGVVVTHANISFSSLVRSHRYTNAPQRFLMVSSFAFDSSMVGLWWTLANGGTVVLPQHGRHDDVSHLAELIERHRVTHLLMLPSLYGALVEAASHEQLKSLRTVIVAGEACHPEVARAHFALLPDTELHNEYGPTEATVWTHSHRVGPDVGHGVPIGTPPPWVDARVTAPDGSLRPAGVPGELWVAGPGIAAGYLGLDDQTADRFVNRDGRRWYRTGDLVSRDVQGVYWFHGRVDQQVKVRGHRIELEAVDVLLGALPDIAEAASVAVEVGARRTVQLVAAVVARRSSNGAVDLAVHAALERSAPPHMRPSRVVELDSMPRLANGKVDRAEVARLVARRLEETPQAGGGGAARTPAEVALASAWSQVLGVDEIGIQDDFFELGGDSIAAIRIAALVRKSGIYLTTRDMFDNTTVEALAALATGGEVREPDPRVVGEVPLSAVQEWFFQCDFAEPNGFVQGVWLETGLGTTEQDLDRLRHALGVVGNHHDVFRARFVGSKGMWQQVFVDESVEIPLIVGRSDPDDLFARVVGQIDLSNGPLFCAGAMSSESGLDVLFVGHHIVTDAVSWSLLAGDLTDLLDSSVTGSRPALAPTMTSVAGWAHDLQRRAQAARAAIANSAPSAAPILSGQPSGPSSTRGPGPEAGTATVERTLERAPDSGRIEQRLVFAVAQAVARHAPSLLTADDEVEVTVERHGREPEAGSKLDLARTVGWFTSTSTYAIGPDAIDAGLPRIEQIMATKPPHGLVDDIAVLSGSRRPVTYDTIRLTHLGEIDNVASDPGLVHKVRGPFAWFSPANNRTQVLGVLSGIVDGAWRLTFDFEEGGPLDRPTVEAIADSTCLALSGTATPGTARFDLSPLSTADMNTLSDLLAELD